MDNPENPVDININSSEALKVADSPSISSTSRYGRARKPKSFFQDFYNTEEVVKRGTKSVSPKNPKKTKISTEDFIHVTGDVDVPSAVAKPFVETTEVSFDNFMKSVSGQAEDVKSLKERKFFKTTQESKLQASTINYISKVSPKPLIQRPVESKIELISSEITEPELDVNKVIKIVTKPTEIEQAADTQKTQKGTVKTYGNKRKTSQNPEVFESFALPDKPFVAPTTKDSPKVIKNTKTSNIDVVINTEDKNQINMNTKITSPNTFFGIKLPPEKPRDSLNLDSTSTTILLQNKSPPKLITSVTRIGKVQPTVTKVKSVLSSDSAKRIFASVSKQNITIVPKTISKSGLTVEPLLKSPDLTKEVQLSPVKSQMASPPISPDNMPTCKIKSITSVSVPTNVNNNNQEKKFVKVVMDKSKVLKVLPTLGGSPIKMTELANTSSESDKSDSVASPPYSPIKPKIISLPSVIHVSPTSKSNILITSTSTPKLNIDYIKTSPKIIASTRFVRKEFMSPMSPIKVIGLPSKECSLSPVKIVAITSPTKSISLSPVRSVPKTSPSDEVIPRKRKQDLILRKESDHSYSISPPNRPMLPIPPKRKFMARMKTELVVLDIEKEPHTDVLKENIEKTKKDAKEVIKEIVEPDKILKDTPKIEEKQVHKPQDDKIVSPTENRTKDVKESSSKPTLITPAAKEQSVESPKVTLRERTISPIVRLTQLDLLESNERKKPLENAAQIINKPLENVGKNIVRVSPRKGKGMNAFLWETNSGVFFLKQTVKGKFTDGLNIDEDNSAAKIVADEDDVIKDKDVLIKDKDVVEDMEVQSSPIEEEESQERYDDDNTKDVVDKIKALPEIRKKEDLVKVPKIINKAKFKTKTVKKISNPMKSVVKKSKKLAGNLKAKDIPVGRQLRTRKFIFAEQITATNRKTVAKVLDKTPKPSKVDAKAKKNILEKEKPVVDTVKKEMEKPNVEIKLEVDDNDKNIKVEEKEIKSKTTLKEKEALNKNIETDTTKENIKRSNRRSIKNLATTPDVNISTIAEVKSKVFIKKSARINKSKQSEVEQLHEDVILIPTQKKIIEITSDDESDECDENLAETLQSIQSLKKNKQDEEQKSVSDFALKTNIKIEKVTPEKMKQAIRVNVQKRKQPNGASKNHIRKLKLSNEDSPKPGKAKIPMPIASSAKGASGFNAEIKTEKMDVEVLEERMHSDKKIRVPERVESKYSEGDMVWAKVGCHPYWPAMITKDPTKHSIKQTISSKLYKIPQYHVRYFADNGRRSWIRASALMIYKDKNDLDVMVKSTPSTYTKKYRVPTSKLTLWKIAVEELESIKDSSLPVKLDFFSKAAIRSAKKKKNATPRLRGIKREKPDDYFDSSPPNSGYKTLSRTRKIPIPITEVKTPTTSRAQRLSSVDTVNKDSPRSHIDRFLQSHQEDRIGWKKLRSRSVDDDQSHSKADSDIQRLRDFDTTDCSSSETDSIHHKISAAGPIPVSAEYQEILVKRNNLFRKVSREKVCEICFKPNNVLSCRGPCCGSYHLDCANGYLDDSTNQITDNISIKLPTKSYKRTRTSRGPAKPESISSNNSDVDSKKSSCKDKKNSKALSTFICGSCDRNDHCVCFVCCKEVSPSGDHVITKCKVAKCGKTYHRECTRLWPQAQWSSKPSNPADPSSSNIVSLVCPRHVCHICVSDDPKTASTHACRSEALVRCLLCPGTYHSLTACIPAGTDIYTHSQIVCPRHLSLPVRASSPSSVLDSASCAPHEYFTKPLQTINTNWCFICSEGGDLVCCERCPTSVHKACTVINWIGEDSYICEDCETGRLILYDEVVWVKLGAYRWWPALVLYPKDVPINVRNMRHRRGEFVIKFFGSYDHHWMGQGRVFLYQDGDKAPTYSGRHAKSLDVTFAKAIEESVEANKLKRDFRKSMLQSDSRQPKSLKPPAYVKIRFNKPVGNVKVYDGNVSITTPCSCDPRADSPCGANTNCINRLLWTECNPRNCPAGQRCQNQQFETRQYPPLVPYMTDGRGWGLKTLVPLAPGQFVIEYVGEVIEEQEYKRRVANMQNQAEMNYYFLTIDSDRIVDAGPKGNVARFMNHSCDPNCETQKWTVNGDTRVGLFASENIPANKELTFNYNLAPNGKSLLECKCKAVGCSGFIGVKKAADNPKTKVISEKLLLKKKKRLAKSNRLKNKHLLDRSCFICLKGGKLITCSNLSCSEAYHIECVKLMNIPYAFWRCPRHCCNVCNRKIVKRCKFCINSYCNQHCNVKEVGKIIEFICPEHKKTSENIKQEITVSTEIISERISEKVVKSKKEESPVIPKEEKVQIDTKVVASNKKVKPNSVKNIKKNTPTKKKVNNKKTKNQTKVKQPAKRQLRHSR